MVAINQQNLLPIINNFVIVPDIDSEKRLPLDEALIAVPGSTITTFFIDRHQRLFKLPAFQSSIGYPSDFYSALREASSKIASTL